MEMRTHCIRCGECCLKSSPTLQADDLHLIEEGRLEAKDLISLRKGEMVTDIVHDTVCPAPEEMIKVREKKGDGGGCLFYDEGARACAVYDVRPLQCRALKCWDTRKILEILSRPKLKRSHVVQKAVLTGLIHEHEKRCAYIAVRDCVLRISSEGHKAVEDLLALIKFDFHLRPFVSGKLGIPVDEMDFYFGRPLAETIENYGLQVIRERDGGFFLTKAHEKRKNGTLE